MKRLWQQASGLLLLLLALAGCQPSGRKLVGVVPKATSHIFWVSVQAGAMAAGQDHGLEVIWNGPASETEYTRQIQIVDSLVARGVNGLAVAATERKALVQAIDRAMAQGIPVTIFDSGIDSENYTTFVATNNYEAGQLGARKLAELIGGRGKVALVLHAPGSFSTMEREQGFEDAIKKEFPEVRIVARQYGMSDRSRSMAAAENILTANPDLKGLFASTEPSSSGAALAINARGLSGKVKFVAFDSSDAMIADLKGGTIDAMVVQDPFRIGYEAVRTLADKLNGRAPPKRLDLSARVVTAAELEQPDVRRLLFPDVQKYLGR